MHARKILATSAAGCLLVLGTMGPAMADNSVISIAKTGTMSATHKIAYLRMVVTCSEDTTSGYISGTLTQVTSGGTQTATSAVSALNAVECTGEEERVTLPVRRPTGGFKWVKGSARASNLYFETTDPSGTYKDSIKGRTVTLE